MRMIAVSILCLLLVDGAYAACKAIPRGAKYGIEWSLYDLEGNVVGFGTGINTYPSGSTRAGTASGNGMGATLYLDGTTTGNFVWTITLSEFSLTTCSGRASIFFEGDLLHSGNFVLSDNSTRSSYVGTLVDPNLVGGARVIRVLERLQ